MIRHDRRAVVAPRIDATHANPKANAIGSHTSCRGYVATMAPATCDSRFCNSTATPQTRYARNVSVSDTDVRALTVRRSEAFRWHVDAVRNDDQAGNRDQPSSNGDDPHEVAHERRDRGVTADKLKIWPVRARTIREIPWAIRMAKSKATVATGNQVRTYIARRFRLFS